MTRVYTFTAGEHQEYGSMGWTPDWVPGFDPASGFGVAHDLLEHIGPQSLTVEDEMRALGAMLFVRAEAGFWDGHLVSASWSWHLQGDLLRMAQEYSTSEGDWVEPANLKPRSHRLEDSYMEGEMEAAFDRVAELIKGEEQDDEEQGYLLSLFEGDYHRRIIQLWREGYRQAKRRYGSSWDACCLFRDIEKQVGREDPEEGQTMTVRLDLKHMRVSVEKSYLD